MILGEPARTQGDLNFNLLGSPVRISVWFWVAGGLLGLNSVSQADSHQRLVLLLGWIAALFISILIHEFGHSLAMRRFGIRSHIVLYHLGGLAIPDSAAGYARHPNQRIMISAAGPFIQIAAAIVLMTMIAVSAHHVPLYGFVANWLQLPGPSEELPRIENFALRNFCFDFLYVSVYWALINLLPVYPLDGGQIAREIFLLYDRSNPIKNSLILSIITGIVMAVWALQNGRTFIALLFGLLAISSYQTLQGYTGGGFGGRQRW